MHRLSTAWRLLCWHVLNRHRQRTAGVLLRGQSRHLGLARSLVRLALQRRQALLGGRRVLARLVVRGLARRQQPVRVLDAPVQAASPLYSALLLLVHCVLDLGNPATLSELN
jgi:hypothetical protein